MDGRAMVSSVAQPSYLEQSYPAALNGVPQDYLMKEKQMPMLSSAFYSWCFWVQWLSLYPTMLVPIPPIQFQQPYINVFHLGKT